MVTDPKSLHYVNPSNPDILNSYQEAIISAADILLEYDADKLVPVYGFGANLNFPNLKTTGASHCFPCSGDPKDDERPGIEGIFEVYNYAIRHVSLNGPTNFEPLFRKILNTCKEKQVENPDNYCFFMVITDGEIHDFDKTADVIVEACDHPMSIVIIGVGNEAFQRMRDFDEGHFTNRLGQKPKRDIVRFVKFNDFKQSRMALSQEVLKEIPIQVEQFYTMMGRKPNPPKTPNRSFAHLNSARPNVATNLTSVPINRPNLAVPTVVGSPYSPQMVELVMQPAKAPVPYSPNRGGMNYPAAPG